MIDDGCQLVAGRYLDAHHAGGAGSILFLVIFNSFFPITPATLNGVAAHEAEELAFQGITNCLISQRRKLRHLGGELVRGAGVILCGFAFSPCGNVQLLHVSISLGLDLIHQMLVVNGVGMKEVMKFGDVLGVRNPYQGVVGLT